MADHVSESKPPAEQVVKQDDGWTSVSNSIRDTKDDAPVELADKPKSDEAPVEEPVADKPKVETKTEDKPAAKTEEIADETADGRESKRKERSRDRVARIRAEIAAATKEKHDVRADKPQETTKVDDKPVDAKTAEPTKPVWEEYEAAGKSWQNFLDDHDAFLEDKIRREVKAETEKETEARIKQERDERAASERRQQYQERLRATQAKFDDFDQVVTEGLKDVPATPFFEGVVKNHPFGPEIAYALAKDPDLALEISQLQPPRHVFDLLRSTDSAEIAVQILAQLTDDPQAYAELCRAHPIKAAKLFAKLEASFERAHDGSRSERPVSKASPPTRPVRGGKVATTSSRSSPDGPDDILDFIKEGNRQEARRHGYRG